MPNNLLENKMHYSLLFFIGRHYELFILCKTVILKSKAMKKFETLKSIFILEIDRP